MTTTDLNRERVEAAYQRQGYPIFGDGLYDLNTFGIRNAQRKAGPQDDVIGVLYRDETGPRCVGWRASTDPGLRWLSEPMRSSGTAIMAPGFYRGLWDASPTSLHRGKYRAGVQRGACRVFRDNNRDHVLDLDPATLQPGAGMNIHHDSGEDLIVLASAGCQVVSPAALAAWLKLVDLQAKHGKGFVCSYALFDEDDDLAPLLAEV